MRVAAVRTPAARTRRAFVAAFDGRRVLVTNRISEVVSLWKGADLTPLGFVSTGAGTSPFGAASDGVHFWITLNSSNQLVRF
jgi:hypothetical protein